MVKPQLGCTEHTTDRTDPNSRTKCMDAIRKYAKPHSGWPQLLIFPEVRLPTLNLRCSQSVAHIALQHNTGHNHQHASSH